MKEPVVIDTSTLLNFILAGRLDILARLDTYSFFVPAGVIAEVKRRKEREDLIQGIHEEIIRVVFMTDQEVELSRNFQDSRNPPVLDAGEAACVSSAVTRRWKIAMDDRAGQRVIRNHIGRRYLLTTKSLLKMAWKKRIISKREMRNFPGI